MEINGAIYRKINTHNTYKVSEHLRSHTASLVDRGANGGIAGNDVRLLPDLSHSAHRTVNIMGIDNHQLLDVPLVTVGGVSNSQKGPVILIFHQYAHYAKGKSIHSPVQLEAYHNEVNDKSAKLPGGGQFIKTNDGYTFPLDICSGLPYLPLRPFSDTELETLPQVIMTGDCEWVPTLLDNIITDSDDWITNVNHVNPGHNKSFDHFGDYQKRTISTHHTSGSHGTTVIHDQGDQFFDATSTHEHEQFFFDADSSYQLDNDDNIRLCMELETTPNSITIASPTKTTTATPDYPALRPYFAWLPPNIVKLTFKNTTQYAKQTISAIMKKHYKSPYPANNVHRRDEPVATDTVYSDTPAIDNGCKIAQFFVGTRSMFTDVYGMKSDNQFVNTLEDQIRERGAMSKLVSDCAQVEISRRVIDILRALCISSWQSEPHQQQQNPAERRYQTVKRMTNTLLDRSGSPAYTWLLAMMYACFILNFSYCASISAVPAQVLTGSTPDISPLLRFYWWQTVYYKVDDSDFPSDSRELRGHFVGIAEHVGHALTFKVLTDDTNKVIYRSNVRPASMEMEYNLRLDPLCGESRQIVKSKSEEPPDSHMLPDGVDSTALSNPKPDQSEAKTTEMTIINPSDLVGRSFLLDANEDGEKFRAKIIEAIDIHDNDLKNNPEHMKYRCNINDDAYEEILSYNEILHHIEKDDNTELVWKFKSITSHQGPMDKNHKDYKGSSYNVKVEWENGEISYEPLDIIGKDDPVTCAIYAREHGLLDKPGWKRFKGIAKREQKMLRMVNQAKLRSYRIVPKYKFGYIVPRDYAHAEELDRTNKNTKWKSSVFLELGQIDDYKTFIDLGKGGTPPEGSKKISVHLIFDIKHDGRHKARLVADGHRTDVPLLSVYSGVVSLRGLRMVTFLAELNELKLWATDIGNAYLEAYTLEKVHIIAGPEFGKRQGHTLVISKALYGLRSSGLRWHEKLSIILKKMRFLPCKAEPDIWMRENHGVYEYIAVYVDDLAICARDPKEVTDALEHKYNFKLKGTGDIKYHLGCDFFRDELGVLCFSPKKYIEKMVDGYKTMFGANPKGNVSSPLEKGDHPEIDDTHLLDEDGIAKYQSLIGSLQWANIPWKI